ncbi:MAG: DUF4003 family protein [Clostridium sp.]
MNESIKYISDKTIENYMTSNDILRYDGTYINHFAGIIYSSHKKEINCKDVKDIRKYIKNKTTRMSAFRGDILYILSILIGANKSMWQGLVDKIIKVYNILIEKGFEESAFLVLPTYVLAKYVQESDLNNIIKKIECNYNLLKEKNVNVTNGDDYLICTLMAIKNVDMNIIQSYFDDIEEYAEEEDVLSNNEIQGLTTAMSLNFRDELSYQVEDFLDELSNRDIRISNKFIHLLGVIGYKQDIHQYVDEIEGVIEYLCSEESSYEFYMDKGFRTILAICIIEASNQKKDNFIDELLALGIYSFLISKNQDVFARVLA